MKVLMLVIDSFGIGALPDAEVFGDAGANTALHICEAIRGEKWPALKKLGLGNASQLLGNNLPGCGVVSEPSALYGVMAERSPGKDTTTGHWELAGIVLDKPFHVFPAEYPSFPEKLIGDFLAETGCGGILGNKAASGTEIIKELGEEHLKTGYPICYTSADSVLQIACHKNVFPVRELYRLCETARKLCDPYYVGRVIARPFDGEPGHFKRTPERHDFSIELPGPSVLDELKEKGIETIGIGKIGSIFNEQGLSVSYHDAGNPACLSRTEKVLKERTDKDRLIFVNLVDTDMLYGHRRDITGYYRAVKKIDDYLRLFIRLLDKDDVMIVTGDHGCDPSFRGTDHTREYVPVLICRKGAPGGEFGIKSSFAAAADYIRNYFLKES